MAERQHPYKLGQTAISGELTDLLGYRAFFNDFDYSATGAKPVLTAMTIEALWVKNSSSGALLPCEIVTWGTPGTIVTAKADALDVAAGVVDPYIPAAGVADGEHFWLIVSGPCKVIHAGNDTITAAEDLVTGASGRVDEFVPTDTAAKDAAARFGVAMAAPADNNAGTKFRALVDFKY